MQESAQSLSRSYTELIQVIGVDYQFIIENGILFAISEKLDRKIPLAKKMNFRSAFKAIDGVKGEYLINQIADLFKVEAKIKNFNDDDIGSIFCDFFSRAMQNVGRGHKYIHID